MNSKMFKDWKKKKQQLLKKTQEKGKEKRARVLDEEFS